MDTDFQLQPRPELLRGESAEGESTEILQPRADDRHRGVCPNDHRL